MRPAYDPRVYPREAALLYFLRLFVGDDDDNGDGHGRARKEGRLNVTRRTRGYRPACPVSGWAAGRVCAHAPGGASASPHPRRGVLTITPNISSKDCTLAAAASSQLTGRYPGSSARPPMLEIALRATRWAHRLQQRRFKYRKLLLLSHPTSTCARVIRSEVINKSWVKIVKYF